MILRLSQKLKHIGLKYIKQINFQSHFSTNGKENFSDKLKKQTHTSQNKKNDLNQQQEKIQFTQQQRKEIDAYQSDQFFNKIFLNVQQNRNLQKDLIISRKKFQRDTKQLRTSILFQDLLKTQIKIIIYDTNGKPYVNQLLIFLFNVFFFASSFLFINFISKADERNKVILQRTDTGKLFKFTMYSFAVWTLFKGLTRYVRFQRRFVQKIIYDTQTQNFLMTKRNFICQKYNQEVSRFKLVYTQNAFLNKKGTNYFNLQTKQQYSIPYKEFWKKQDLFSHLIAQRIKL